MINYNYISRNLNGILLLDKPQDISSNKILQKVKYMYNASRAGHVGTLDPLATGMLPICFGNTTKFSYYLLNSNKTYRVVAKLGQQTDTSDKYGKIIKERPVTFNMLHLEQTLKSFHGNIIQIPSMYSAIKYHGKKLYEYARNGIKVPRKKRKITIYQIILINYKNQELELEICCSKGTYIRTIIDDIGEKLGCGAHVIYLRRLTINNYPIDKMVKFETLQKFEKESKNKGISKFIFLDKFLIPIDSIIIDYPVVNLSLKYSCNFKEGKPINLINNFKNNLIKVTEGERNNFIGIGKINNQGQLIPICLID